MNAQTSIVAGDGDDAFWQKVDRRGPDECWPWTGFLTEKGYGRICRGRKGNVRAHRLAYYLANGVDPGRKVVCHKCDNPKCCNPAHLWLGTQLENIADRVAKGRTRAARGEATNKTPLTACQVIDMRARFDPNVRGMIAAAAREFNISKTGAKDILRRKTWAHI